jgi:hypothetical protein
MRAIVTPAASTPVTATEEPMSRRLCSDRKYGEASEK